MSTRIDIKNVVKKYGDKTIIDGLDLVINPGEFFTLLGPSGCGKTTLLRMIAGFNSIEGGDIYFNDQRINDIDVSKRNIGMVFQNYAVFPHLTVRKNVQYGLKTRKMPKDKMLEETEKFLSLMQIQEYRDRLPESLSGGQQQRVALARALVIQPDVLLMDEPLSNLDAKLRVEMRSAIKDIQHNIGITTVYVTHDQEEALAVSDRIAVMNHGEIQQVGSGWDIYQHPSNLFVASFIGKTNILDAVLQGGDGKPALVLKNGQEITLGKEFAGKRKQNVKVSIRPEGFKVAEDGDLNATVKNWTFLGNTIHYIMVLDGGEEVEILQDTLQNKIIPEGQKVKLSVIAESVNIFDEENGENLLKGAEYGNS
ncbi:MAG: ABC transporter ATP-binding protein [Candidatus Ornithospirochaeta sp.]|nr:ABC transporter ATP-binding protein [Sphaerochaetaceae bacterium]MDY5523303.1 ABC transporter ATP-binding protein [Candidatus Ornithospirochaeta sp.]